MNLVSEIACNLHSNCSLKLVNPFSGVKVQHWPLKCNGGELATVAEKPYSFTVLLYLF